MNTERQQEIIENALDLINEKGIQGLTIKNLSKRLGITEPAIYRHFENKIQILVSILDLLKKNTSGIFVDEISRDVSATLKVELLFEKHFQSFVRMPSMASVVFSEEIFRNEEMLTDKISEVIEQNNRDLFMILEDGQKKGEIRSDVDAGHLVILIMGSLRLFVKKWQYSGFSFNLETEGKKLVKSVILMISGK
ncbi:transcriptional regulator, TetR family [Bacteroidales bacterium 6E]|nr:transcriptional regulator, TetR family [Bacteroidales bacterium 6E]